MCHWFKMYFSSTLVYCISWLQSCTVVLLTLQSISKISVIEGRSFGRTTLLKVSNFLVLLFGWTFLFVLLITFMIHNYHRKILKWPFYDYWCLGPWLMNSWLGEKKIWLLTWKSIFNQLLEYQQAFFFLGSIDGLVSLCKKI